MAGKMTLDLVSAPTRCRNRNIVHSPEATSILTGDIFFDVEGLVVTAGWPGAEDHSLDRLSLLLCCVPPIFAQLWA